MPFKSEPVVELWVDTLHSLSLSKMCLFEKHAAPSEKLKSGS